jgi:hypothetical protein
MVAHLESATASQMNHEELEAYIVRDGCELQRRLLQAHLDLRAAAEVPTLVVGSDNVERRGRRRSHRPLMSLVGEVSVRRLLYQAAGVEGLCPQDAALNLPCEKYSLGVRRRVAEEVAANSFDHAVERVASTTGAHVPKRQLEQLAQRAAEDFDAFYLERTLDAEPPDALLILTFDGAGVPMRVEHLRESTRKAAEEERAGAQPQLKRPSATKASKKQKRNRKRMAQVAAIYAVAPYMRSAEDVIRQLQGVQDVDVRARRPKPVNKKVYAGIVDDAREVIGARFCEAAARDPEGRRTWVVLVDGDEHQLRCVRQAAKAAGKEIIIVLDVMHVLGYLWRAAHCFHKPGSKEAERWVLERLRMLLTGAGASDVAAGMRRSATRKRLTRRGPVDKCATYLCNNRDHLRYADALAKGLPIATGVIEGACRFLVRDRLDQTGARWSAPGAESVLRLRALRANGDFDAYWSFHTATEFRVNHAALYADNCVPDASPPPPLRLVK